MAVVDDLVPAVGAVTATPGVALPVGRFRYDVATGSWWWSDGVYEMHGFSRGEVAPSTELLLAHQHPEDRDAAAGLVTAAVAGGPPFCSRHRIIDTRQRVHTVVTIGEGIGDPTGEIIEVRGYFIDVTEPVRRETEEQISEAVQRSAQTRAAIEQAKGALMAIYAIDSDEAFAVLRWHSQHLNIRVRELAARLTEQLTAPQTADLPPRRRINEILADIADTPHLQWPPLRRASAPGDPDTA